MMCSRFARSNIRARDASEPDPTPKGRQVDPTAAHEIELLLGDRPRRRDLLIEHLHLIQDKYHQISAAHLAALADEMKLSFAEVFETATFYAHFDVVKEGEPDIAPLTIRVCDSLTCAMLGAEKLLHELQSKRRSRHSRGARALRRLLRHRAGGRGRPSLCLNATTVARCWRRPRAARPIAICPTISTTTPMSQDGGYKLLERPALRRDRQGRRSQGARRFRLRGLGGAGFPTGRKWRAVLGEPGPRLMAVNGDEGEPGTFKDRFYLLRDPHRFLEGMLIGAHVVEAPDVYIYLRDEYPAARETPADRNRQAAAGRSDACTCGAAPAPISAARNPRCSKASRASAACRGTSRHIRSRSGCSACRR